jgi:hypothetical protein
MKLSAAAILLIIRYWAIEDVHLKEELHLVLSTEILSMAALERLRILTAKFTVCVKLYAVNNAFISFSRFHRDSLCLCHHTLKIKISDYTRINSRPLLLIVHINDLPPTINTLP